MRILGVLASVALGIILLPDPLWAWGPATHVFVGTQILGALSLLPTAVSAILRRYPHDFLYGCIAADIPLGKKYAPVGRHCHHWHVGKELYAAAESDATRACALGYLTHLGGDTTAHNHFLSRQLLTSAYTQTIGHSYWEHRMDVHLGARHIEAVRHLILEFDHSHNDDLFDRVLARTVFSFHTNRRIFRGMIRVANHDYWQAFFDRVIDRSRWEVEASEVDFWLRHAFEFSIDYLIRRDASIAARLDPTGEANLIKARTLRRRFGSPRPQTAEERRKLADEHFPLPEALPGWWKRRNEARGIRLPLLEPTQRRDETIRRLRRRRAAGDRTPV